MKRIRTLEALQLAATNRRAVTVPSLRCWGSRSHPAAFMINQSGQVLLRLFIAGMFIYKSKHKKPVYEFYMEKTERSVEIIFRIRGNSKKAYMQLDERGKWHPSAVSAYAVRKHFKKIAAPL